MPNNQPLQVDHFEERQRVYYGKENKLLPSSGGWYYYLSSGTSVKHTMSDTWICLKSSCGAYDNGTDKGKGCDHTQAAKRYAKLHDHVLQS